MTPDWFIMAAENHWRMPTAPLWKRLPVIRHIRAIWHSAYVAQQEAFWLSLGSIPTGYDRWVLAGIWGGMERAP